MTRPKWFSCKQCLFLEVGKCRFNNKSVEQYGDSFCSDWICKNCWQNWNDWTWDDGEQTEYRTDHTSCQEVQFK